MTSFVILNGQQDTKRRKTGLVENIFPMKLLSYIIKWVFLSSTSLNWTTEYVDQVCFWY